MRALRDGPVLLFLLAACTATEEARPGGPLQTESDERIRYELLDPHDHEFRITYELAVTRPGARTYCTPVRGDTFISEVTAEDVFSGESLDVGLVPGDRAQKFGHPAADSQGSYLLIALDRPVPEHGEVRLRVRTKYEDRTSYRFHGEELEFARLLAAPVVSVVLPPDHAVVECNVPVRIRRLDDGRLELAYEKRGRAPLPLRILARHVEGGPGERTSEAGAWLARPYYFEGEPLVEEVEIEVLDPDAGRIRWRCHLELPEREAGAAADGHLVVLPTARELSIHARDTGERLELVPAPEGTNGQTAHTWTAPSEVERRRVTIEAEVEAGAEPGAPIGAARAAADRPSTAERICPLRIDAPAPRRIGLPPGWSVAASSQPIALQRLPDGRSRIELGGSPPAGAVLTLTLWKPVAREPALEPAVPVPAEPAPAPSKRKFDLD